MLMQNAIGCFCVGYILYYILYLFLVLNFLNGACLFRMVRKAFKKNTQASSTDGMRSISFQDTPARPIRKACSQKCFRERLTVMRGGHLVADPLGV